MEEFSSIPLEVGDDESAGEGEEDDFDFDFASAAAEWEEDSLVTF